MFNLKMPTGEWYNADWIEFIKSNNIEVESYYSDVPIEFRYKQYVDEEGVSYPLPGLKSSGQSIVIETSADLEFKSEDKITFSIPGGTTKTYRISNVSYIRETSNNLAAFNFPGAVNDYVRTVITL